MKLYSENTSYKLYQGSMLDMLSEIQPNSIDSIVTDPPYELNFEGCDKRLAQLETEIEMLWSEVEYLKEKIK